VIIVVSEKRRSEIFLKLSEINKPIKGTKLAEIFQVSRQVIVQDIAILRAQGAEIIATPNGYIIYKRNNEGIIKTIVSKHQDYDAIEDELQIMVDYGAKILDVIVEHPLYGEIKGMLDIRCKEDVEEFMKKIKHVKAEPLSSLTEGVHIHTIEVPSEKSYEKIKEALIQKGYLITD
jgi:uncharacterized protein